MTIKEKAVTNITEGHYDLESGYFYVHEHQVEEKPKTYKTYGGSLFYKEDENCVRLIKGSDTRCPRLEVFTTDTVKPVQKLQSLISEWMDNRKTMVPLKTKVNGKWQCTKENVKQYMESIDLNAYGLSDIEFPTKEDVDLICFNLEQLERPDFFSLKVEVHSLLNSMQLEMELD